MFRQLLIAALVGVANSAYSTKIDGGVSTTLHANGVVDIFVSFVGDLDIVHENVRSMRFATRGAQITTMMNQLEEIRLSSQKEAIELLEARGVPYISLWVNNRIYVKGACQQLIDELAGITKVTEIRREIRIQLEQPIPATNNTINAEWGIGKIEAEAAWSLPGGNNGAGIVVANIDGGVRGTHEALRNNLRKTYNWYDPAGRTSSPTDRDGHGTHTMGTMVGSGGIGVAPGAQWIACKGCKSGGCWEAELIQCGQWIACPTLSDGTSADCSKAPNVVSNSWGGGQGDTFYDSVIKAWQTAKVVPVFSQGNEGPACGTGNSPGDNPNVIAAASTTATDNISAFSSRGPSRRGSVKPDVSAPGTNIRSTWHSSDTAYNTYSGTSMACPHVAGTIALILGRNRDMSYSQMKSLLQDNADRDLGSTPTCDNKPPAVFPNSVYGYGRINARKSLEAAINGLY